MTRDDQGSVLWVSPVWVGECWCSMLDSVKKQVAWIINAHFNPSHVESSFCRWFQTFPATHRSPSQRHPNATVGRPAAAVHHHFLRIAAHDAVAARVVEGIRNAASHAGGGAWGLGCGWAEMLTAEMLTIPQRKKLTTVGNLDVAMADGSNVGSQQEAANIKLHGGLPMLAEWSWLGPVGLPLAFKHLEGSQLTNLSHRADVPYRQGPHVHPDQALAEVIREQLKMKQVIIWKFHKIPIFNGESSIGINYLPYQ